MYEGDIQSVLRCKQCNKPFDKQSTLKRHGYYCRSRRISSTTRTRSCISCARGKTRCDNKQPECSRCITKSLQCQYPNPSKGTGYKIYHDDHTSTEGQKATPSLVADSPSINSHQDASNDSDMIFNSGLVISDSEFTNLDKEYFDLIDPDIDFTTYLTPQMNDEDDQYPTSRTMDSQSTLSTIQVQEPKSSNISIPRIPTSTYRSLIQRPRMKSEVQRIANITFQTLKSYPLMMIRNKTLPPFIHPRLISSDFEKNYMEPLTNCISLMHMISSGVQGSRKLFWKNVRLECERFCEDYLNFNKWELLAAIQALSIYLLIRLDEGQTEYNNYDVLLVKTIMIIAKQLSYSDIRNNMQSSSDDYSPEINWKDWIFEESSRRICIIYQVVNLLIYFDPAAMCEHSTELILAPLPAKKQLWEANDEIMWKSENERESGYQTNFGLAANGELVILEEGQNSCNNTMLVHKSLDVRTPTSNRTSWAEWYSEMDGFGGLIMLAASLTV